MTDRSASDIAPVLIADIGGTNARFAFAGKQIPTIDQLPSTATVRHPSFEAAARFALKATDRHGIAVRHAIIAVAGPVTGPRFQLTNAPWMIDAHAILKHLDLETLIVLNDFEAQAMALPTLSSADLASIGQGAPDQDGTKVVLGPGTGLGVAALARVNGRWTPIPGEGGHVEIGPVDAEDYRVWPHIARIGGRISAEAIVSGAGLLRLAHAVSAAEDADRLFGQPSDVIDAVEAGDDIARLAFSIFARALGRMAGDMALTFLARGGVYLSGGIAPRVAHILTTSGFRESFVSKAPHNALMAQIPTYLVTHPAPALAGLSAYARAPEGFYVDTSKRRWGRQAS